MECKVSCRGVVWFRAWVLIETSWNVKYTADKIYTTLCQGINRNIVECKGKRKYVQLRFPDVLIETSWNVKTGIYPLSLAVWWVLIETSWNVKIKNPISIMPGLFVLIETLWNVKIQSSWPFFLHFRINRNIVECKVRMYFLFLSDTQY